MAETLRSPTRVHAGGMGPLAEDLDEGRIEEVLFCHLSSRWYAGELFCHAAWIGSLEAAGLKISVCTKDSFLELFSRHPAVRSLHPARALTPQLAAAYPLVVFAATHPPDAFAAGIEHGLYSWNKGLAYAHRGRLMQRLDKQAINHFRSSQPHHEQLPLPDGGYLRLHLGDDELAEGGRWLDRLGLDPARRVIVLNPSSSNPVTRRSDRPKAVDNLLFVEDYSALIRALRSRFPDEAILVGSPVLAADEVNHRLVRELCDEAAAPDSVIPLHGPLHGGRTAKPEIGFREFAALLAQPRVRGMAGNSTGSNAHLAATLGVPSLSIERAVDDSIRANWAQPDRGQMGSVAWRNPEPRMAAYTLSWQEHDDDDFAQIAESFRLHLCAAEGRWENLFKHPEQAAGQAQACLDHARFADRTATAAWLSELARFRDALSSPEAVDFYFDLSDEAAFLRARGKDEAASLVEAVDGLRAPAATPAEPPVGPPPAEDQPVLHELLADSNLFKLLKARARSAEPRP
jgi:hypothetical protein